MPIFIYRQRSVYVPVFSGLSVMDVLIKGGVWEILVIKVCSQCYILGNSLPKIMTIEKKRLLSAVTGQFFVVCSRGVFMAASS